MADPTQLELCTKRLQKDKFKHLTIAQLKARATEYGLSTRGMRSRKQLCQLILNQRAKTNDPKIRAFDPLFKELRIAKQLEQQVVAKERRVVKTEQRRQQLLANLKKLSKQHNALKVDYAGLKEKLALTDAELSELEASLARDYIALDILTEYCDSHREQCFPGFSETYMDRGSYDALRRELTKARSEHTKEIAKLGETMAKDYVAITELMDFCEGNLEKCVRNYKDRFVVKSQYDALDRKYQANLAGFEKRISDLDQERDDEVTALRREVTELKAKHQVELEKAVKAAAQTVGEDCPGVRKLAGKHAREKNRLEQELVDQEREYEDEIVGIMTEHNLVFDEVQENVKQLYRQQQEELGKIGKRHEREVGAVVSIHE